MNVTFSEPEPRFPEIVRFAVAFEYGEMLNCVLSREQNALSLEWPSVPFCHTFPRFSMRTGTVTFSFSLRVTFRLSGTSRTSTTWLIVQVRLCSLMKKPSGDLARMVSRNIQLAGNC